MESKSYKESLSSGALAGLASVLALQPLDVIKTRLQEQPRTTAPWHLRLQDAIGAIQRQHGVLGFWRGTLPTLFRNVPGVAVYFVTLQQLQYLLLVAHQRRWLSARLDRALWDDSAMRPTGLGNMLIGGAARAVAGFLLMPATVLKVRFESRAYDYRSMSVALRQIVQMEGLRGLFRGAGVTALRDVPHAALYLLLYRRLQRLLPEDLGNVEMARNLVAAGSASMVATLMTQPMDLAKTRVQLAKRPTNFWLVFGKVVRNEGLLGLFNGMGPRLLRKGLSSAVTWSVFEYLMTSRH